MPDHEQTVEITLAVPVDVMVIITIAQTIDSTQVITVPIYNQNWYGAEIVWDSVITSGSLYSERVVWGLFTITQTINQTEIIDNPDYDTETAGQIIEFVIISFNVLNSFRYLDQNKQPIIFSSRSPDTMPIIFSSRSDPNMPIIFRSPAGIRYNINQTNTIGNPNNNDDYSEGLPAFNVSDAQRSLVTIAQSTNKIQSAPLTNLSFKVGGQMVVFLGVQILNCTVVNNVNVQDNMTIQLNSINIRVNQNNVIKTS